MSTASGIMMVYDRKQNRLGTVQDFGAGRILACKLVNGKAKSLGFFDTRELARAAIESGTAPPRPPGPEAA